MQLQFHKNISSEQSSLEFDPIESRHIVKVLRHKEGDEMFVTNGRGLLVKGLISNAHPKHCELQITEYQTYKSPHQYYLHIGIAPTKNIDRLEWFVEKATEIGVHRITPILCERSERKVVKHERLEKIIVAAMKQSGQFYLPQLDDLTTFKDFVSQNFEGERFIAHCLEEEKKLLFSSLKANKVQILIGPEGDFSKAEISQAFEKKYVPVSLGNTRLRTETAGIAAAQSVNLKFTF